jgi:hypothetical protein
LNCAATRIDGEDIAKRIMAVPASEIADYRLQGCFDPDDRRDDMCFGGALPPKPPPHVYLLDEADSSWHSAMRYEYLCRVRSWIKEGDPRRCTASRWETEIEPLFLPAFAACRAEWDKRKIATPSGELTQPVLAAPPTER